MDWGTTNVLVTSSGGIQVFRPGDSGGPLTLLKEVAADETGAALRLNGRFTDQIAFSADGTLAFIAATSG